MGSDPHAMQMPMIVSSLSTPLIYRMSTTWRATR